MLPTRLGNDFGFRLSFRATTLATIASFMSVSATAGASTPMATVPVTAPSAISHSTLVSKVSASTVFHLNIALQPSNPTAFQTFIDAVSNPSSATYRQFLTPAQIGQKFGQPASVVSAVVSYLKSQGMTIKLQSADNLHILADATATQAQAAFSTTLNNYHSNSSSEPGYVNYISFATAPKAPSSFASAIQNIGGLQTWDKPIHHTTLTPSMSRTLYGVEPLFTKGFEGQNRTLGISNWDGFRLSNLPLFINEYGLPFPSQGPGSNVSVVTVDGGSQGGLAQGEGDLDQQMMLAQAPLANIIVYDGGGLDGGNVLLDVLTEEMDQNKCDVISESYGWSLSTSDAESAHIVHQEMSAEGITYMAATGDYQVAEEAIYFYPDTEPEVLLVGGTTAQTDTAGNRLSEVAWDDGSGGWSPVALPFNVLPSWQVGTGVPVGINQRLNPDVSGHAAGANGAEDTGAYFIYYDGGLSAFDGTSCASPTFAAGLGIAEQKLASLGYLPITSAGNQRFGRIADRIYKLNGRSSVFYDITSGNNGTLPNGSPSNAGLGWDTCTGWGAINWVGFVNSVIPPVNVAPRLAEVYVDPVAGAEGISPTGNATSLGLEDNSYYSIESKTLSAGQVAAGEMSWTLTVSPSALSDLGLTVVTNAPSTVTQFIYLLNVQTGNWDLVSTKPMTGSDYAVTIDVNTANYVSTSNQVSMIARGVMPTRFGSTAFRLNLDEASLAESF